MSDASAAAALSAAGSCTGPASGWRRPASTLRDNRNVTGIAAAAAINGAIRADTPSHSTSTTTPTLVVT